MVGAQEDRRGRGKRAGITIDTIVSAARGLPPDEVTMQGVADRLGVDRKALNHHVSDRESLLELLAIDAYRRRLDAQQIDLGQTWQDACRAYGHALWQTTVDTGEWVAHFRFTGPQDLAAADASEVIAERLLATGLDETTASRAMHLLVTSCTGFARDAVIGGRVGGHPQIEALRATFAQTSAGYPALRRLVDARVDNFGEDQLRFDLDAYVAGIERLIP